MSRAGTRGSTEGLTGSASLAPESGTVRQNTVQTRQAGVRDQIEGTVPFTRQKSACGAHYSVSRCNTLA